MAGDNRRMDNQLIELTIEDMSVEGQGIGRTDTGMVLFVEGAVKGDKVRAKIGKAKKNFAFAKATEILEPSPLRNAKFDCAYYEQGCGGCPLGPLEYGAQLEIKEKQVRDRLERIAGVRFTPGDEEDSASDRIDAGYAKFRSIVGMDETENEDQGPWRYRNKAVMKISTGGLMTRKGGVQEPVHEPRIGFNQARTHDVVDCIDCRLQIGTAMAAAEATRRFMAEDNICSYDDRWDKGLMRQMTVKTAFGTGEVMVIYDINGKGIPNAAKLVEYLDDAVYEAGGSLESVVIRNDKKTESIAGKNTITDIVSIGDEDPVELKFEISANSFYQVNHGQMERLYARVRDYVAKVGFSDAEEGRGTDADEVAGRKQRKPVIFDLYCGIGTIGLCVADIASHVHGVEIVKEAVNDANRNAVINGIVNATYTCGKAEELIPQWVEEGREEAGADIAILDPPRAGCRKELLEAVAFAEIPRIIYVSCDPATLARDIKVLAELGYRLREATPYDLFPATSHVETVCLMSRVK